MKEKTCLFRKKHGFTLVELLVIIAILGIIAGIAIPSYVSWMPSFHLKNATRDIISNLRLAKLEAIKRNTNCAVTINTGANTYNIDLLNKTVSLADYKSGVSFTNVTSTTTGIITFSRQGMATFDVSDGGTSKIYLTNSKHTTTHEIDVNGVGTIIFKK
jgi:prepilin-type N-terminal cleavage/methylation domain-containing protein